MLKVTTPLVNKGQPVSPKLSTEAINTFNLQSSTKVIQVHNEKQLEQQNNGFRGDGEAPVLLLNLLKDPGVAVSYLKNIFLLEEIFRLLPANNKTVTKEIEQLFQALMIKSDEIKDEMIKQEKASTKFKGEFFDFLRQLSRNHRDSEEIQTSIANLLKSLNNLIAKDEIRESIINSLSYLKDNYQTSENISEKLDYLIVRLNQEKDNASFQDIKKEIMNLFSEMEESLLFTPKISKVISIIIYNLSRYNENENFFQESVFLLRQLLTNAEQLEFTKYLGNFNHSLENEVQYESLNFQGKNMSSQVMDSLIKLILKQAQDKSIISADSNKIDQILYSLLSSPCNFTPLLHFIIPTNFNNVRSFAEMWINPDSEDAKAKDDGEKRRHFLLVIEIESVGKFEAEIFSYKDNVDFNLYCPPKYVDKYQNMMKKLPEIVSKKTTYRLKEMKILPMEKSRSLMEVFKSLPYKRVGIDVKI